MKLPSFEYLVPESLEECCKFAAAAGAKARVIAGGTDLLAAMKYGLQKPEMLIDISRLVPLTAIDYGDDTGLTVGSLVTLRHLARHRAVREKYPLLVQAVLSVGSVQLQAMGTVGGNLCQDTRCIYYDLPPISRQTLPPCFKTAGDRCHAVPGDKACWATFSGDVAPALLALQAKVTIADGEGERTIPVSKLYSGRGEIPHTLKAGQILKEIHIPPPAGKTGVYLKLRVRKSIDYPLLGVAVQLLSDGKGGTLQDISLALTAVGKAPFVITNPEGAGEDMNLERQTEMLAGAAYKAAHPVANTSGYAPRYRREMVKVFVRQAIRQAMRIASGRRTDP